MSENRTDLTFPSGGARCAAWLYRPQGAAPHPLVIMAHGFGGVREARLWEYAERFAAAGFAALVFDYRHFGASEGEPRQELDVARQHEDWRSALAFARTLEGIDQERIALWGTSFSGGHVIEIAAGDPGVAAAVAQEPFVDGLLTLRRLGVRPALRLTAAGLRDEVQRLAGRGPFPIPIVAPPGAVGAMTSPDALPGYAAMFPEGVEWTNAVNARILLRVGTYRPIRAAERVACPLLVLVCDGDVITPPEAAAQAAARAPRGEVRHYPGGHFDIYQGEVFERSVADEIEFLTRHLAPRGAAVAGATG